MRFTQIGLRPRGRRRRDFTYHKRENYKNNEARPQLSHQTLYTKKLGSSQ